MIFITSPRARTSRMRIVWPGPLCHTPAGRGRTGKSIDSVRLHWQEYLMEAGELSIYMFSVCAFATLSWHPASLIRRFIVGATPRRILMGLGTGTTLFAIVMSPWGKQSGSHLNPAI